ncbi:MAG: hypothetical protein BWK80_44540 [Desulfobacteraceae bacterium IS3]|nr:MAG: hypothetical protein BWK80_44540 [Desulfobacteraceae bacterium IS3]
MQQLSEKSQYILLEDIKKNPEIIAQLLFKDRDVSIILEKQGDRVRFSYLKTYSREAVRILEEAKKEYEETEEKGYTREQAFEDFTEARNEISRYL